MSVPPVVRRPDAHVVAAALFDAEGRLLLAERPKGKHMAGGWEFPGGKREAGEERIDTLKRELREEVGIEILEAEPLIAYEHEFPDRTIKLDLWFVTKYSGTPQSLEGQNLRWVALAGEVVIDYSNRLRQEIGSDLWVFGYSTDVMAYIPSERVLKEGRYEGETSMIPHGRPSKWNPGLEDQIVVKTRELVERTRAGR